MYLRISKPKSAINETVSLRAINISYIASDRNDIFMVTPPFRLATLGTFPKGQARLIAFSLNFISTFLVPPRGELSR